ncbi:DUF6507 family protein [Kribbella sp. NPDC003557]|uniref:DUF6507 family protein n=1 Tax=Kribbella sp. NPDC003557 TaxID=3154449 RepID=UPI0033A7236D
MTDWDIDPEGVSQVLQATYDEATKLETYAGNYGQYLQGAASNAGGLIADALNGFAISYNGSFNAIAAQVIASMTGAKDATIAYLDGHYEMALNAQRGANGAFDREHQVAQRKSEEQLKAREGQREPSSSGRPGAGKFEKAGGDELGPAEPYTGTGATSTVESGKTPGGAA